MGVFMFDLDDARVRPIWLDRPDGFNPSAVSDEGVSQLGEKVVGELNEFSLINGLAGVCLFGLLLTLFMPSKLKQQTTTKTQLLNYICLRNDANDVCTLINRLTKLNSMYLAVWVSFDSRCPVDSQHFSAPDWQPPSPTTEFGRDRATDDAVSSSARSSGRRRCH